MTHSLCPPDEEFCPPPMIKVTGILGLVFRIQCLIFQQRSRQIPSKPLRWLKSKLVRPFFINRRILAGNLKSQQKVYFLYF
jgi:hypothetical protein